MPFGGLRVDQYFLWIDRTSSFHCEVSLDGTDAHLAGGLAVSPGYGSENDELLTITGGTEAMKRRQLLAITGGAVLTPGCGSALQSDVQLGGIFASNHTESPQTIEIEVLIDEDVIHASSHELDPVHRINGTRGRADSAFIPCDWSEEPAMFEVRARTQDSEWEHMSLSDEGNYDCYTVHAEIPPNFDNGVILHARPCDNTDAEWGCEFIGER